MLSEYLSRFPNGIFSKLAKLRLKALQASKQAALSSPLDQTPTPLSPSLTRSVHTCDRLAAHPSDPDKKAIGIALNNAIACIEALLGHDSPFIRTPKYNICATDTTPDSPGKTGIARVIPIPSMKISISVLELAMGLYMLLCVWLSLHAQHTIVSTPFLLLFAAGYLYVGSTSLWVHYRGRMESRRPQPQPA